EQLDLGDVEPGPLLGGLVELEFFGEAPRPPRARRLLRTGKLESGYSGYPAPAGTVPSANGSRGSSSGGAGAGAVAEAATAAKAECTGRGSAVNSLVVRILHR